MADSVWYYARGDVEKGPLTTLQIKALVAAGKLRRDDFVWKEGMESWRPAGEISELFPNGKPGPDSATATQPQTGSDETLPQTLTSRRQRAAWRDAGPTDSLRPICIALLLLGFVMVLTSRGCDMLSRRNIDRLQAIAENARRDFDHQAERRLQGLTPSERQKTEAADIQRRQELEDSLWRDYDRDAEAAELNHRLWAYWRELTFLLGTLVLALGLMGVGFSNAGPERWVCFAILAVIVYSLYAAQGIWTAAAS